MTEVRTKAGVLVGFSEPIETLSGTSTTHAWVTCLWCGRKFLLSISDAPTRLAHHRLSLTKKDACQMAVWWKGLKVLLGYPRVGRVDMHTDEWRERTAPLVLAFGERWPVRFWVAHPDQVRHELDRARAAYERNRPLD